MVFTRPQARAAFNHVLDNVLGQDDQSPLKQSLIAQGIEDIFYLCTIENDSINALVYDRSATETDVPVNKGDRSLLKVLLAYVTYVRGNGTNALSDGTEWGAITQNDFDEYRISPHYVAPGSASSPTASNVTTAATTLADARSPADFFRRGIKRDSNLFPVLKDEKFNDTWHRSFANQARAQDVMEVLDPLYVPETTEHKELFNEKQKYMYAILEQKVLTDRGKGFVRDHEADYNAQKVYQKLVDHHLKSTKAMIDSSTIQSYITSVRLGNGMWKGTTEGFIIHWENQVRLYERQVPVTDHFSDGQKRTMLENAVAPIDELRQIKGNADLEKVKTERTLTFGEYSSLLLSASAAYDDAFKPKLAKRLAYAHEIGDAQDVFDTDDPEEYGIDVSVHELQAYVHNRTSRPRTNQKGKEQAQRTRMPFDRWSKLSTNERALWDQLDETAKATILGSTAPTSGPAATRTTKRHTNLHEISAYDYIQANIHETAQNSTAEDLDQYHEAKEIEDPDDDHDPALLINSATSNTTLTPGDIRRVMSSSSKRYQGPTSSDNKKSTREVKMHVTYTVSALRSTAQQSLVDQGSNGGVAGSDVRVISKSHRKVDIVALTTTSLMMLK